MFLFILECFSLKLINNKILRKRNKIYPSFVTMLISLKSTLLSIAGSIILVTESTQIGANKLEYWDTT